MIDTGYYRQRIVDLQSDKVMGWDSLCLSFSKLIPILDEIDALRVQRGDYELERGLLEEKLRIAVEALASIAANHKPELGDARHWNKLPSSVLSLTIVEDTMIAREALVEIDKVKNG